MSAPSRRSGKKQAQVEMERREREAKALRLRAQNMGYDDIAHACGWTNEAVARTAVKRALARHEEEDVATYRQVEDAKLDRQEAELRQIITARAPVVQYGKVVTLVNPETGERESLEDFGPKLRAISAFRQVTARRAALHGLDAPPRKYVEVVTLDLVESEIARVEALADQMEAENAAYLESEARTDE